jgi:hypothetical protein
MNSPTPPTNVVVPVTGTGDVSYFHESALAVDKWNRRETDYMICLSVINPTLQLKA